MYSRLLKIPLSLQKSFFLFGPRGTGKTAWVRAQFSKGLYLDLLETGLYIDLLAKPQRLETLIPPQFQDWIIIDEVQKVPALLNEVHRLIEKNHYRFVLTGSSARSLRKKGVNLLAGRALTFSMYPLTTIELGQDFDFERSLHYGHLPTVFSDPDPKRYLNAYVHTYLQEEILQEGLTRSLGSFMRFSEIASFSQGCLLNLSEVAREVGIHRKVVESYFLILEDLLLAFRLPVFSKRAKRALMVHPKFYFFDVGVFRALRPQGPLDRVAELEGPALETLFIQECRALNDYYGWEYQAYYWRTRQGLEVDFVFYGPRGLVAVEIKRANTVSQHDFKGLAAFAEDYPEAKLYMLYGGDRREYHGAIEVIPFKTALQNLALLFLHTMGL
jgi:uncharacterized protein